MNLRYDLEESGLTKPAVFRVPTLWVEGYSVIHLQDKCVIVGDLNGLIKEKNMLEYRYCQRRKTCLNIDIVSVSSRTELASQSQVSEGQYIAKLADSFFIFSLRPL